VVKDDALDVARRVIGLVIAMNPEIVEAVVPEVASCAANWAILLVIVEMVRAVPATATGIIRTAVAAEGGAVGAAGLVPGLVLAHPRGDIAGPGLARPGKDTAGPDLVLLPRGDPNPSPPLPREIPVHRAQKRAVLLQHMQIVVLRAKEAAPLKRIVPVLLMKEAEAGEDRRLLKLTTPQRIKPISKSPLITAAFSLLLFLFPPIIFVLPPLPLYLF